MPEEEWSNIREAGGLKKHFKGVEFPESVLASAGFTCYLYGDLNTLSWIKAAANGAFESPSLN